MKKGNVFFTKKNWEGDKLQDKKSPALFLHMLLDQFRQELISYYQQEKIPEEKIEVFLATDYNIPVILKYLNRYIKKEVEVEMFGLAMKMLDENNCYECGDTENKNSLKSKLTKFCENMGLKFSEVFQLSQKPEFEMKYIFHLKNEKILERLLFQALCKYGLATDETPITTISIRANIGMK